MLALPSPTHLNTVLLPVARGRGLSHWEGSGLAKVGHQSVMFLMETVAPEVRDWLPYMLVMVLVMVMESMLRMWSSFLLILIRLTSVSLIDLAWLGQHHSG